MSKSLVLESLEIRNFRAFRHLRIERLGRVNLVAGRNNVGKTCLLEALWLYARRGDPRLVMPILEGRDEIGGLPRDDSVEYAEALFEGFKYLFYGRKDIREQPVSFQIGPLDSQDDRFCVGIAWYTEQISEEGRRSLRRLEPESYGAIESQVLGLSIQLGESTFSYPLDRPMNFARYVRIPADFREISSFFVPANGLGRNEISQYWDNIALTPLEEDVLAALCIMAPIDRVNFVERGNRYRGRVPIVRIAGLGIPIPLGNLGEGMNRLLGIALALVNAKDGLLLVDEIDSGLHYTVQPDLWRLVFQVARRLNVQVFATTHNWDCVEGFQQAAQEDTEADGMYIRLEERNGEIVAILFDEDRLGIATREEIEIR